MGGKLFTTTFPLLFPMKVWEGDMKDILQDLSIPSLITAIENNLFSVLFVHDR